MKNTVISAVAAVALAVSVLSPIAPARAQSNPQADIAASKATIDAYVKYMSDPAAFRTINVNGQALVLPYGLFGQVDAWYGAFSAARTGSLRLSDYAVGYPGTLDANRGAGVEGFYGACKKYRDFLGKTQGLANRMVEASQRPSDSSQAEKIAQGLRVVVNIAQNAMAVTLTDQGGTSSVHGNAVCAQALADIYYSFNNTPNSDSFDCMANLLSDPGRDPANANGTCVSRRRDTLSVSTMPECAKGTGCNASAVTNCSSPTGCFWYDYTSRSPRIAANLKILEDYLVAEEAKFSAIANEQAGAKAQADAASAAAAAAAAAEAAAVLARGSVLTLPLPLGSIEPAALAGRLIASLLGIVGALTLVMFIWSGLSWMLARGDAKKIAVAQQTITWAAIGLVAIFSSYAVLNLVLNSFTS